MKDTLYLQLDSVARDTVLGKVDSLQISMSSASLDNQLPEPLGILFCKGAAFWALVVAIVVVISFLYCKLPNGCRNWLWEKSTRWFLPLLFVLSWSMGFIVYCVGGYAKDFNALSVVFMSIIHATEMFVGSSDISAVQEPQHTNGTYMIMFGLSHFLALLCSLLFIIRQIGFFFISKLKAWWASRIQAAKNVCFVFWGINDASLSLADTVVKFCKKKDISSYRIVFVRTHDDSEKESEGYNPQNLFDKIRTRKSDLEKLRKLDCIVVSSSKRLSLQTLRGCEDVLGNMLGLFSLKRIIEKSRHTCLFIISDDGEANVKAAINLTSDTTIKSKSAEIYCHCRKSAKTLSMEYYEATHPNEGTNVHIVDTSYLSVSQLKMNEERHPVKHVKVNKDATIDTPFCSMIVGFGETGQEALRFLYEFGAFVGSDKRKSPFHCAVFDKNMQERRGLFMAQTPFMKTCNEIILYGHAIDSPEYWNVIKEQLIGRLNYIVICPGSDDLALEAASNLCTMAITCRNEQSPQKLTICIRSYDASNAARLNDFCQDINMRYKKYGIQVHPFGILDELFTHECIIQDEMLQKAMDYNYSYFDSPANISKEKLWRKELGYHDGAEYTIDEIKDIERKRDQNYSNTLHAKTKVYILQQTGCDTARIPSEIEENMARLEHERWMASMHINGWQRLTETTKPDGSIVTRNTVRKLHADLCPWEEIRSWDKEEQKKTHNYDRKVLTTTLELEKSKKK